MEETAAQKCNRFLHNYRTPRDELDDLYNTIRLQERKEIKRFLQDRVSKSVSDYIYQYEEQRRMMNLPEIGSVDQLVQKIFDWISMQTQYKGSVRSGPRTAAIKDIGHQEEEDSTIAPDEQMDVDNDGNISAMSKGNAGYTGSTGTRTKGQSFLHAEPSTKDHTASARQY